MRKSEKCALIAAAIGSVAGGGIAWFFPGAAWWFYVGIGAAVAGFSFKELLKWEALENLANMRDR